MDIQISLLIFSSISFLIAFLIYYLSANLILVTYYAEKFSIYECGFMPYNDVFVLIDVHFYLVAILFIIFDLELVYLMPFVLSIDFLSLVGYLAFCLFLIILTLGFVYECLIGALDW